MRALLIPLILITLGACSFGGTGVAPFTPAPAAVAEEDLEVPFVPTPRRVVEVMLDMARVGPEDYLVDLGSGDGRIAVAAAQRGARALGVDLDSLRVAEAVAAARIAGVESRARFRRQDLFDTPIGEASVVAMYLLPEVNLRLRPRLLTELGPGARIVSHAFDMGDWRPDEHRVVDAANLYLWIVPAVVGGRWALTDAAGETMILELEQRFQEVSGTLARGGRVVPIQDAALRGTRLRFTADTASGPQTFRGIVGDASMEADPGAPPDAVGGWTARRIG